MWIAAGYAILSILLCNFIDRVEKNIVDIVTLS